ncbi:hypothetical protein LMG29542_07977 [Paraburkholderia humisilvae]|uniref:Uncharacterized protein n=2 Tax=Paraburkholderia humisilvae TaxID=627669 RepID=A0A6J5F719_9BURK|nr:hypothetical protein LMG29542_07977 [Paraburkholderia humisilvae]
MTTVVMVEHIESKTLLIYDPNSTFKNKLSFSKKTPKGASFSWTTNLSVDDINSSKITGATLKVLLDKDPSNGLFISCSNPVTAGSPLSLASSNAALFGYAGPATDGSGGQTVSVNNSTGCFLNSGNTGSDDSTVIVGVLGQGIQFSVIPS